MLVIVDGKSFSPSDLHEVVVVSVQASASFISFNSALSNESNTA
jgi:hypothetical protein